MRKIRYFGAGPAQVPARVLHEAEQAIRSWQGAMSILEWGHRTPEYEALLAANSAMLRDLLQIPDTFAILWMHGGAHAQFSAVPLNLLPPGCCAQYIETGLWSTRARVEAEHFGQIARATRDGRGSWGGAEFKYVHYTDNETVDGAEFVTPPPSPRDPSSGACNGLLVSDMTSNLLTRPVEWDRYLCVYAGTQKTLGISGSAVVIVRRAALAWERAGPIPYVMDYARWERSHSLGNTPAVFNGFLVHAMLRWIQDQGGVAALAQETARKAARIYAVLDGSPYYTHTVDPAWRSRLNAVCHLADPAALPVFLQAAQAAGLWGLKGHAAYGGVRISLYPGVSWEDTTVLADFMEAFAHVSDYHD